MEFLQCWIGRKPKKTLLDCIESVRKHVGSKDKYTMISTTNFLEDSSVNWIPYKEYLENLKLNKDVCNFIKVIDNYSYSSINTTKSDIIRFKYTSDNEDVLYVDTDVILKSLPAFDINKIYFAPNRNRRTTIDSYIFYNGHNTELPQYILKKAIENFLDTYKSVHNITSVVIKSWAFMIFNNIMIRKQVEKIDRIHFEHLEDTRI